MAWSALIPMLFGQGLNAYSGQTMAGAQKDINRTNINEARQVMAQQREWALSDWDKVNSYNSPSQQMQRYKEAGLNPNLIYGSAQNSPSAMVKATTQGAARADAGGIIAGQQQLTGAISGAVNAYMGMKSLENDTNLKNAQILNLKSQADKTQLDNDITRKNFNELAIKAAVDNEFKRTQTAYTYQQGLNLPTEGMARERYSVETSKIQSQAKHAEELYNLAKQQGKLKAGDIDMLDKLGKSPMGLQYAIEFLKIILNNKTR